MIPVLVAAGQRVICPDLVGFGRSDKPTDLGLVHLRPPRRAGHGRARHARPAGRDGRRAGLGRGDRPALGGRARRPRRAARDHEHRPVHRAGSARASWPGASSPRASGSSCRSARSCRARRRPSCPTRSSPPTRRRSRRRRARRAPPASRCSCRWTPRRPAPRRCERSATRSPRWDEAVPGRVLGLRPGLPVPAGRRGLRRAASRAPASRSASRARAHFLQEDRGEHIAGRDRRASSMAVIRRLQPRRGPRAGAQRRSPGPVDVLNLIKTDPSASPPTAGTASSWRRRCGPSAAGRAG